MPVLKYVLGMGAVPIDVDLFKGGSTLIGFCNDPSTLASIAFGARVFEQAPVSPSVTSALTILDNVTSSGVTYELRGDSADYNLAGKQFNVGFKLA